MYPTPGKGEQNAWQIMFGSSGLPTLAGSSKRSLITITPLLKVRGVMIDKSINPDNGG